MFGFSFQEPVAHSWSGPSFFRRRFCCVCRKRLEDHVAFRCQGESAMNQIKYGSFGHEFQRASLLFCKRNVCEKVK